MGREFVGRRPLFQAGLFPSSKYSRELRQGEDGVNRILGIALLWEYFKFNFSQGGHSWRTCLTLVLDQLKNVILCLICWTHHVFLDVVSNGKIAEAHKYWAAEQRESRLMMLVAAGIGLVLLLHVWDSVRAKLDLSGRSRLLLQTLLLRRYLNCSEDSRIQILSCDLQFEVMLGSARVANAYARILDLLQVVGMLIVLAYFVLPRSAEVLLLVAPLLFLFVSLCCFFSLGQSTMASTTQELQTCRLIRQICVQRSTETEPFFQTVDGLQVLHAQAGLADVHKRFSSIWLGGAAICLYTAWCGPKTSFGEIPLGGFIWTLESVVLIVYFFSEALQHTAALAASIGPLRQLTDHLNKAHDYALQDDSV